MKELFDQIQRTEDAPVRNCSIGVSIRCIPYEIREAIKSGKYRFQRNASYRQQHPDETGCNNYALEDVTIFYDEAGNAIDYDMPDTDPEQMLDFTLLAGLVGYGTDLQGVLTGISEKSPREGEWEDLEQNFNSLMHTVQQANRSLFPPDRIMVGGKPYEVAAVSICENLTCIYNSGKTQIAPFPKIAQ